MKTDQEINLARMHVSAMLNGLPVPVHLLPPDVRSALSGMYAALCWALEIPGVPSQQFAAVIGEGHKGALLTSPQGLDLKLLRPSTDS